LTLHPLPNSVRAGAGKANAYLGQIQPGRGIKILEGSVCADGLSWWLVESIETQLQGWTVVCIGPKKWTIPCLNPKTACEKLAVTPKITLTVTFTLAEENINNTCNTDKFAFGMFAQVPDDNPLAVRYEPYTGIVIGKVI